MRTCINCQYRLGEADLLDVQSQRMEAERISVGLEGVYFRYYTCPRCSHDHVFLEVVRLRGESNHDFRGRKKALTRAAQETKAAQTTILVVEQGVGQV